MQGTSENVPDSKTSHPHCVPEDGRTSTDTIGAIATCSLFVTQLPSCSYASCLIVACRVHATFTHADMNSLSPDRDGRKLMREQKVKHTLHLNRFLARAGGFVASGPECATMADLGLQDLCPSHTHRPKAHITLRAPKQKHYIMNRLASDFLYRYLRLGATKLHEATRDRT